MSECRCTFFFLLVSEEMSVGTSKTKLADATGGPKFNSIQGVQVFLPAEVYSGASSDGGDRRRLRLRDGSCLSDDERNCDRSGRPMNIDETEAEFSSSVGFYRMKLTMTD